ncbi:methylated-DNA--[protein]-cysteine S-methyltransferase [Kocuria marina]|uniref:methylated-DNA--[protein]-cysteine S-methyltransferase n=1 Tax=Kocuria marina TaxID=223184 RepID=UPI0011A8248B|nr:methylated-DNA--[protein]-cysteine S-methyltransferase [Kocuria indica]
MTYVVESIGTPDGSFTVVAREDGTVVASGWTRSTEQLLARICPAFRPEEAQSGDVPALEAVRAFYDGNLNSVMTVPVDLHGTEGQQAGWAALRRIHPGSPLTYTEFARELGNPRAVRAAASVCARNPVALFVPCHRVLRSDGSMGGFAWGEAIKRDLLRREARSAA